MKYIKTGLTILMAALFSSLLVAQNWHWMADMTGNARSQVNVLKIDNNGDLIVFIAFEGTITVGGRSMTAVGMQDMLLSKFTSDGDTLWNRPIGSLGEESPRRMFITDNDEILITGGFEGDCDFGGTTLSVTDDEDIFLAKYLPDGTLDWAKRIAWGTGQQRSSGICLDAGGGIALTGFFAGEIIFDGQTINPAAGTDNFFAKFDANGNFIRAIPYLGTANQTRLNEISFSVDHAFLITGFYRGTLTTQTQDITSVNDDDILLIKTDTLGNEIWIRTAGGSGRDRGTNASSDKYGNIYITGYVSNTNNFDTLALNDRASSQISSVGGHDMIAAKYNKNGILQWKTRNGNTLTDRGQGISVYNNIVQFTGLFTDSITLGDDLLVSKTPTAFEAGFFIYNTNGDAIKGVSVQGSLEDQGADVVYDNAGNSYMAGYFMSDTLYAGAHIALNGTPDNDRNPYLVKYEIPLSITFTKEQHINCYDSLTGEIIVTPYYGQYPFTYSWSHNGALNDSTASDLGAGTYTVTVTDNRGRQAISSTTLTEPDSIEVASVLSDVDCHPDNGISDNGAINLTVSGGTVDADYTYAWEALSGSGVEVSDQDQATLTAGSYRVTVTDDNMCTNIKAYTIGQPDSIHFTGSLVTNATGGGSDGEIDLNPAGGNDTPPYTSYAWSNLATTEDITGLSANNYSVTVTDALGCEGDTSFLVQDVTAFQAYIASVTHIDCKGNSTGSATVATTGGTGPYSYAWENSGGSSVGGDFPSLSNVTWGTYYVTVTDNDDMRQAQANVTIREPAAALSATSIFGTNLTCSGNNSGIVNFSPAGGTLPYSFSWEGPSGFTATTEDIVDLSAGLYSVTVTDDNNCSANNNVTLTEPGSLGLNIVKTQTINCFSELTGILTADVTGRPENELSYQWNDPANQNTKEATELEAGTYGVTVTDLNGCNVSGQSSLSQPAQLVLAATPTHILCFGDETGRINLTPSGGTPLYNYDWSNGDIVQDLIDIPAGNYTVEVTDALNCSAQLEVEVQQPPQLAVQSVQTDSSCLGLSNGLISIQMQGGSEPYRYSVDGGTTYQDDSVFSNLTPDSYTISVLDNNNCESSTIDTVVEQVVRVHYQNIEVDSSCLGLDNGLIRLQMTGGTRPYSYSVNNGAAYQPDSLFTGLAAGSYTLKITDDIGCQSESRDTAVSEAVLVVIDRAVPVIASCKGASDGQIGITVAGSGTNYEYSVDSGYTYQSNPVFTGLTAGAYTILVRDDNGCLSPADTTVVTEPNDPEIIITDTTISHVSDGSNGMIGVEAEGGSLPYTFILYSQADEQSNAEGTFENLGIGNYIVIVEDDNTCKSDSVLITLEEGSGLGLVIYNAFSPNNDGVNDTWSIGNIDRFPECKVNVINTWGNKVFSSDGYPEPWDGTYNGSELPAGTYYYIIDLGDGSDAVSGPVSIVR